MVTPTQRRMRRARLTLVAVVLMAVAAAPVHAAEQPQEGRVEFFEVSGSFYTDSGYGGLSISSRNGPDPYTSFFVIGELPDLFYCQSFGDGGADDLLPEIQFVGRDLVRLSGSFLPSDFDSCEGAVPSTISFDLEFEAVTVYLEESRTRINLVKGEILFPPENTHTMTWRGQDALISGVSNGEAINSTFYGGFMAMSELPA